MRLTFLVLAFATTGAGAGRYFVIIFDIKLVAKTSIAKKIKTKA